MTTGTDLVERADPPKGVDAKNWLRAFITYLVRKGVVTTDALASVLKVQAAIDKRIGQLAAIKGYITPRDILFVVTSQVELKMKFGEVAVQKGIMTPEQVEAVLKIQDNPFRLFLECIQLSRIVNETELQGLIKGFLESSNITMQAEDLPGKETENRRTLGIPDGRAVRTENDAVRNALKRITGLATLPTVVQRVLALLEDPEVRLENIAAIVQADPVLSSQLLRLVNSAFFGIRGKVGTVTKAMITLGMNGVRQVVLTVTVLERFKPSEAAEAKKVWKHGIHTAMWARTLGRARKSADAEEAFSAGLLHDLGRLVIGQHFPEAAVEIRAATAAGTPEADAETKALGLTHADVGAYLCQLWKFPIGLCQAVMLHHATPTALGATKGLLPASALVSAACRLAHATEGPDWPQGLAGIEDGFVSFHGFERGFFLEHAVRVREEADNLAAAIL